MPKIRIQRFESELEKLFSVVLANKVQDPRLEWVSITRVRLSSDLQFAKVYFSHYDPEGEPRTRDELAKLLTKSSGVFKSELAAAHMMRTIPQLTFHYDDTEEKAAGIDGLLDQIARERQDREKNASPNGDSTE